jgi:hypothetical protein
MVLYSYCRYLCQTLAQERRSAAYCLLLKCKNGRLWTANVWKPVAFSIWLDLQVLVVGFWYSTHEMKPFKVHTTRRSIGCESYGEELSQWPGTWSEILVVKVWDTVIRSPQRLFVSFVSPSLGRSTVHEVY